MNNEEEINSTKKINLAAFGKALAFFAMEILAIVAFSLGNSFIFYTIAGLVLAVVSTIITRKQITKDGLSTFAFFLFPIFVYGVLCALSYMRQDTYFDLQGLKVIFIPLGLSAFSAVGYFLSLVKEFKIKYAMIVIYSAIAILVVINLIATITDFGFFHTIVYKGKYLFYDGKISGSSINDMAMSLMGFKMSEVSIRFFSFLPSILLSAFIPLFFIKFNDDKKLFILYLVFGSIGLIALILTPNKWTLVTDALLVAVLTLLVLALKKKWGKRFLIVLGVFGGLVAIGLIIATINAQTGSDNALRSFIAGNSILNKLFNANRIAAPINCALDGLFTTSRVLGTPINIYDYTYKQGLLVTGSWLFDSIYVSGLFGLGFFILILVSGIRRMAMYYRNSDDSIQEKVTIIAFVFTFLTYTLVNFDITPFIFKNTVIPMYENGVFLVTIFLLSYCFAKSEKPKENVEETAKENVEENITMEEVKNDEISL